MIRKRMTLHDGNAGAPRIEDTQRQGTLKLHSQVQRTGARELLLLAALTGGAVVLHGYQIGRAHV